MSAIHLPLKIIIRVQTNNSTGNRVNCNHDHIHEKSKTHMYSEHNGIWLIERWSKQRNNVIKIIDKRQYLLKLVLMCFLTDENNKKKKEQTYEWTIQRMWKTTNWHAKELKLIEKDKIMSWSASRCQSNGDEAKMIITSRVKTSLCFCQLFFDLNHCRICRRLIFFSCHNFVSLAFFTTLMLLKCTSCVYRSFFFLHVHNILYHSQKKNQRK